MLNITRFSISSLLLSASLASLDAATVHVSPAGDDQNPGTAEKPYATLAQAQNTARKYSGKEAVTVFLHEGTYYLNAPLVFTAADAGTKTAPVRYEAAEQEHPVISGGMKLNLAWSPYKDGIFQAPAPESLVTEELFVNGERQILARYPNFNPSAQYFDGFALDAISKERVARWADPTGGYFHAMHPSLWGDFTWLITGKKPDGEVALEGGWQNNRGGQIHPKIRFVENLFEELDAPGEWFLNRKTHVLYYYPPAGMDLKTAVVEVTRLPCLIEFKGDKAAPVRFVDLKGLTFRHVARTVMQTKEPLLRTDWAICRNGAVFFNGSEDCSLTDAFLDQVGGNAVFANNYNRRIAIRGCEIAKAGASGVVFLGDYQAVRNPLFNYGQRQSLADIDRTPGPKSDNYPADCLVEDCLIHLTGRVEKQSAGVNIDVAQNITVRHCSIYDMPRAGINIGDGCWGGHVIESCDVFDTVKETGDHGSFNSWGRDRYWGLKGVDLNTVTQGENKDLPLLDAVGKNILRNSRWRCDHGWDIDLDDGSSNYEIRNNLCLSGGIKNREGFFRVVENNIMVNNSYHPHVWYGHSQDKFSHNIVFTAYRPVMKSPWGLGALEIDYNLLQSAGTEPVPAVGLKQQTGRDEHSLIANAQFMDPATGDYRVKEGSPALGLGFTNFPMDQFGVVSPRLKQKARTPVLPVPGTMNEQKSKRDPSIGSWFGAKVKNLIGLGEMSATGLGSETGVELVDVPEGSAAKNAGLKWNDVVLKCDGKPTDTVAALRSVWAGAKNTVKLEIWRNQAAMTLAVTKEEALPNNPAFNAR